MNTEFLGTGVELMVVGMTTVFVILLIVIYLGKTLIALVNKFAPEEEVVSKTHAVPQTVAVDAQTMAVISEAVKTLTGGKGSVANVEKI